MQSGSTSDTHAAGPSLPPYRVASSERMQFEISPAIPSARFDASKPAFFSPGSHGTPLPPPFANLVTHLPLIFHPRFLVPRRQDL
ncbi:hypothetical protein LX36DRAFT_660758 [Colletotrichum falcatum]|nr:hypothetical protein LX36DRAFT_660758 [Colletotrichum falcatum]